MYILPCATIFTKHKNMYLFQNLEDRNGPIYPGSNVTKAQSLLLILCFVLRHKLTDVAIEDLLLVFNTLFPNIVPTSKYKFYKSFQLEQSEVCYLNFNYCW